MSYRQIKCWFCGQVPHPLDTGHAAYCARIYADRAAAQQDAKGEQP